MNGIERLIYLKPLFYFFCAEVDYLDARHFTIGAQKKKNKYGPFRDNEFFIDMVLRYWIDYASKGRLVVIPKVKSQKI